MASRGLGGLEGMRVLGTLAVAAVFLVVADPAEAAPAAAFIAGFTGATAAAAAGTFSALAFSVGSFLGQTLLGSVLLNVGIAYLTAPKNRRGGGGGAPLPDVEAARINSRISDPERFQIGGHVAVGGAAGIFGEFDADGNFWYIVAHGDAELAGSPSYILDSVEVQTSDGTDGFTAGDVLTDDFCLNGENDVFESGTRVPQFRLFTVTPDALNLYGAKPSAFTSAFPNLPLDFLLAGVCYTIVRVKSVSAEHRHKVYRWRGPMGLGEPRVTLVGNFSRMYDPRNLAHVLADDATWTASDGNSAILWAWWRTHRFGRNRPLTEINWERTAAAAEICDQTVLDRIGQEVPRYRCGFAAGDTTPRHQIEQDILRTCDGFVAYDEEGRAYPVVGTYEAPTLTFTAERDIISARTEIIDDGEAPVDGVVVRYISPDHGYVKQDCAPWQNPDYYVSGREPNYQYVDILGCQNHNQAFRLAGAIGARIAAPRKAALGCNIKGILAKSQRSISLEYDATFSGVHEVATPVKESPDGAATAFAVVPLASNRWDGAGRSEGQPPDLPPALNIDQSLAVADNVAVTSEQVETDSGSAVRLMATFDQPSRIDRFYRFRFALKGTTDYEYFRVDMEGGKALSAIVADGAEYDVQWQTVTAGGRASGWAADVGGGETKYEITATANTTAPSDLLASNVVAGGTGEADATWSTDNDVNQYAVRLYRGATSDFSAATLVSTVISFANTDGGATETGVTAGSWNYWLQPINGSGVPGNADGPFSVTVT